MRAAVYCGTRNVYQDMIPSMKSLLIHSNVEKIYFLIEDDEFPYELPPEVECINISNQQWFDINTCPNMKNRCSYMVLLRVVFSKIFPHLDRILTIDNDTVVKNNISELWDLDLSNYYLAGCPEYNKTTSTFTYINMGLAMLNLEKIRKDKKDDELLYNLNNYYYLEAEQSCINQGCQNAILVLPNTYNSNWYTIKQENTTQTKIQHFAYTQKWQTLPIIEKYRNIDIKRNIPDKIDLDIIIPHYNNEKGLIRTIQSVYYPGLHNLHITIVDDCSTNVNFDRIKNMFSNINIIFQNTNAGPGAARQTGIDNTSSAFIMFIDAGDYIKSGTLQKILKTISKHSDAYILSWGWRNQETNEIYTNDTWSLHGTCFMREFLELYNIRFPEDKNKSYCGEDLSFMQLCYLTMTQIKSDERIAHLYSNNNYVYYRTYEPSSIMHSNPHEKIIKGIVYNMEYVDTCAKKQNIFPPYTSKRITWFMIQLYLEYIKCGKECPELLEYNRKLIKYYYDHVYRTYEKINETYLQEQYHKRMPQLVKWTSAAIPKINLNRFLGEIKND